jgi:hypothetical protein
MTQTKKPSHGNIPITPVEEMPLIQEKDMPA